MLYSRGGIQDICACSICLSFPEHFNTYFTYRKHLSLHCNQTRPGTHHIYCIWKQRLAPPGKQINWRGLDSTIRQVLCHVQVNKSVPLVNFRDHQFRFTFQLPRNWRDKKRKQTQAATSQVNDQGVKSTMLKQCSCGLSSATSATTIRNNINTYSSPWVIDLSFAVSFPLVSAPA